MQINPNIQTVAQGTFGVSWDGLVQGTVMPDPETRFSLSGGWLDPASTQSVWGGMGISENVPTMQLATPPTLPQPAQGGRVAIATNLTGGATLLTLTGFSVFEQAHAMVNTPQSPVPLTDVYGQVMFHRLGSMARIVLQMDPTLAASLYDKPITQPVSWDFANQRIIAFATTALPVKLLRVYPSGCMTVSYASGTGFATWNYNGAAAVVML